MQMLWEKKLLIIILCVTMLIMIGVTASSVSVSALTHTESSASLNKTFKKKWSHIWYDGAKGAYRMRMKFGYTTKAINEDFTWTNGSGIGQYKHTPYVINANGTHKGKMQTAFNTSKKEVRHKGKTVKYKVYYKK